MVYQDKEEKLKYQKSLVETFLIQFQSDLGL